MPTHDHALVVGKFAPLHRGHQLLLDRAHEAAGAVTVIVWSNPDFPEMPNDIRAGWVRALYPDANVIVAGDGPPNEADDDVHWRYVATQLAARGLAPDVVLTSEQYGPGFAAHLGAAHISVDDSRVLRPISGSTIRQDIHGHREQMDPRVYSHFVQRVVFLGAESTGKTELARRMALAYDTASVDEYGRTYYEERGGDLRLDDYVTIALEHRRREDEAALVAKRYLFVDTNAITTMFFSHYYNGDSRPELRALAEACRTRYHVTIVCGDDIPFEQDGWRDNEVWRARMQGMVLHDLVVRGIPYSVVHGTLEERVAQVTAILAGASPDAPAEQRSVGPKPPTGRRIEAPRR